MRVNLSLVVRADNGSTPERRLVTLNRAISKVEELIRYSFPADTSSLYLHKSIDHESGVAHFLWTNEASAVNAAPFIQLGDGAFSQLGELVSPYTIETISGHLDLLTLSKGLGGTFGLMRSGKGSIESVTDATRSFGVYYGESESLRVMGSRALLVHLLLEANGELNYEPRPRYSALPLRHMVMQGHYMGNQTPFVGVKALSESSRLRMDPWYSRIDSMRSLGGGVSDASITEVSGQVADALLASFEPLSGSSLTLQLTGGRDSRIIAAALANRGDIDFTTSTSGVPEHPDVYLAQQISAILGVPHRVNPPRGFDSTAKVIQAEDPLSRITRALDIHDAMTSGWDDVATYAPYSPSRQMSGVGGEILRGGLLLTDLDSLSGTDARQRLWNTMVSAPFLRSSFQEAAQAFAQPLLDMAMIEPHRAIDDYYYFHRNNRWVAARRAGARHRSNPFDPLMDNRLIRILREVPASNRWNEELFFLALSRLSPELRDLPVEGNRWRFERQAPNSQLGQDIADSWALRKAEITPQASHNATWQRLRSSEAKKRVDELILDNSSTLDWLFDRKKLENYLAPEIPPYPTVVWHTATVVAMLTTQWFETSRPKTVDTFEIQL